MSRYEELTITNVVVDSVTIDGAERATALAGEATLHALAGTIESEPLATPVGANYTLRLANNKLRESDIVLVAARRGTSTIRRMQVLEVLPINGEVVIRVRNAGVGPFDGTIRISFLIVRFFGG